MRRNGRNKGKNADGDRYSRHEQIISQGEAYEVDGVDREGGWLRVNEGGNCRGIAGVEYIAVV